MCSSYTWSFASVEMELAFHLLLKSKARLFQVTSVFRGDMQLFCTFGRMETSSKSIHISKIITEALGRHDLDVDFRPISDPPQQTLFQAGLDTFCPFNALSLLPLSKCDTQWWRRIWTQVPYLGMSLFWFRGEQLRMLSGVVRGLWWFEKLWMKR